MDKFGNVMKCLILSQTLYLISDQMRLLINHESPPLWNLFSLTFIIQWNECTTSIYICPNTASALWFGDIKIILTAQQHNRNLHNKSICIYFKLYSWSQAWNKYFYLPLDESFTCHVNIYVHTCSHNFCYKKFLK